MANTEEQHLYNIPEFTADLINNLTNEGEIIYNKNHKDDTYLNNALFYMLWTNHGRTVKLYAYGYKPTNYKHIKQLGNLYFGCSDWFVLFTIDPFNSNEFHKLTDIIYYHPENN